MKKIISMLSDEKGNISNKRVVVWLGTVTLCVLGFIATKKVIHVDANIINGIVWIVGLCITGTTVDKFSPKPPAETPRLDPAAAPTEPEP